MNILNIDLKSLLPLAIEAYTHVYGEMYREIITERIKETIILSYQDPDGASSYARFLKDCKRKELAMEFLRRIGIDTTPYEKENYTGEMDPRVGVLLEPYIHSIYLGMDIEEADYFAPLHAFDPSNTELPEKLLKNRIKLINYLRGEDKEKLTEESFDTFTQTEEYTRLLGKINELRAIHSELLKQCAEWEKCVIPYEEYAESESKRKDEILKEKKSELFYDIMASLPQAIKNKFVGKTLEEQQKMFFSGNDISSKFTVETFRSENMNKLSSPDISFSDKYWIVLWQTLYLGEMGANVPEIRADEIQTEAGIKKYLEFLKNDDIRDYIPSEDLINFIATSRERKYEETLQIYHFTRKDIIKIFKESNYDLDDITSIYDIIKEKMVCISSKINNYEVIKRLFYTVRTGDGGYLLFSLLHEIGHMIDGTKNGCGFELNWTYNDKLERNPYNKKYRKYEKFNETINDIFTMEANEFLHKQGIYPIESQQFTMLDVSNFDTAAISKDLLRPLLQRYREEVIKAKVKVDQRQLTDYIGFENFEALVDAVNKVDNLVRNDLLYKLKSCPDDPLVMEYYEQVERVKQIYIDIDNYSKNLSITLSDYSSIEIGGI